MPPLGRRRRHGSETDWGCTFTTKALSLFLLVSFGWGGFVFTRVGGPTGPASGQGAGMASIRSMNLAAPAAQGGYRMQQQSADQASSPKKAEEADRWTWNEVPQDDRFFLVFSTDCSGYQNWQSLAIFFSADEVRQPGTIIRIASGCTEVGARYSCILVNPIGSGGNADNGSSVLTPIDLIHCLMPPLTEPEAGHPGAL